MHTVVGTAFRNKVGDVGLDEVQRCEAVCLFFGANWAPPSRAFAGVLVDFYKAVNFPDRRLEIITVSCDKDEAGFHQQVDPQPWLHIPFADPRIAALKTLFHVSTLPILILLKKDGSEALRSARADVQHDGAACFDRWIALVD